MPGIIMDNGERNGPHTNHDRDQRPNGVNGEILVTEKGLDKGKGRELMQNMTPTSPTGPNVLNGMVASQLPAAEAIPVDVQEGINQLPEEIIHITQGFMPLANLLTRFAQKTHNELAAKITELAQMPVPASAVNGNASHASVDDNSAENVNKKHRLLEFAQNAHTDWTKAFVLTSWSRNSEEVSKLIDLKVHLDLQASKYFEAIHGLAAVRRELGAARIPNPDLKTAVQVLSTGKAPWMPEFDYIPPPPLTSKDLASTIENLNTLLSIRLNLHEYDKIPWQFKNYSIKSGRASFGVLGEFEVDLGIADEDPESQFWFIDFRFLFSPSLPELPLPAFKHLEDKVNVVLRDGLLGCYKLLHEVVLTHKITEFRRQAIELSRGRWIDTLKVELLNRSLSIQYWVDSHGKERPKSWIILGVHSGRRRDDLPDTRTTSRLSIRWFRGGKEVKETDIPFDSVNISAVVLLKSVIAMHVKSILTSIYEKMQQNAVFANHEANLTLFTSPDEPAESTLKVQLMKSEHLTIGIEPTTGKFCLSPPSAMINHIETHLNTIQDPASNGHTAVEKLRALVAMEDFTSHGLSAGWIRERAPKIDGDELKSKLTKNALHSAWFRRASWLKNWWAVLQLGTDGERWFLVETIGNPSNNTAISVSIEMAISGVSSVPTYDFLSRLSTYAAALIANFVNLRTLHSLHARHTLQEISSTSRVRVPFILMRLSELLPSKNKSPRTKKAWARETVKLVFRGLEPTAPEEILQSAQILAPQATFRNGNAKVAGSNTPAVRVPAAQSTAPEPVSRQLSAGEGSVVVTEARMTVEVAQALTVLKERVDRDIAFDAKTGVFAFRLSSKVGETVIPAFIERAIRVERLVDFVEVLHKHENTLKCEYISLGRIVFLYGNVHFTDTVGAYKATVDFGSTDNIMTLEFEEGNPHLRIADYLTKVLNEKQGLDGVATLLPFTLPALRALDTLENAWTSLSSKGRAIVFVRAVEWLVIRYDIFSPDQSPPRKIMFEIRLQQRRGSPWWYVKRTDSREREGDDLDAALKPVWNSSGTGWQGMRVNAVAEPAGMEELIRRLDEVMRDFVSGVGASAEESASAPAQAKPPQRAPEAPMMAQPQRQQPTPNQSQNQSQGRNTPSQGRGSQQGQQGRLNSSIKREREIVEID